MYLFTPNGCVKERATQATVAELNTLPPYWLHFGRPVKSLEQALTKKANFPNFVGENLCAEETRPRSIVTPEGLLLILRGVNLMPGAAPDDMVSLRIWLTPKGLITINYHQVQAIHQTENDLKHQIAMSSPVEVLLTIIDHLFGHIENAIYDLDDQLDYVEANLNELSVEEASGKVANVRQKIIRFRRYLQPQRDAILRLPYDKLSWLPNADQMYLRDLADSMVRYAEDLDAVRERARVIQDNITNQLTEKVNNKMYILSIIAIIFMPASFITGIFGMDIEVPGATNKHTFYILCSIIVVLSVGLFVWFRRKKWL
jgi:zinc transporter